MPPGLAENDLVLLRLADDGLRDEMAESQVDEASATVSVQVSPDPAVCFASSEANQMNFVAKEALVRSRSACED